MELNMYIIYEELREQAFPLTKNNLRGIIRQKNRMSVNAQQVEGNKNLSTRGCKKYYEV
jgi:hypothetical protein